jgi:putative transposase
MTMPNAQWERTKQISAVIAPLTDQAPVGLAAVDEAAASLGISRRQVYVLLKRHREGTGLLSDLAPGRSSGAPFRVCYEARPSNGSSLFHSAGGWV